MRPVTDIRERFMKGLDVMKPDWFIVYATQQELIDCARACTDERSGTVQAKTKLRRDVCERLFVILSAGVESGIVEYDAIVTTE